MRVAVTGAAGFLGRAFVESLRRDDRIEEIVAIDLDAPAPLGANVSAVRCDINETGVIRHLRSVDAVVDFAFRDHDGRASVDASVAAARNLFEAAIDAGAGTIVYASSSAVYGSAPDNPVPLREDHPLRPARFAYPMTKAMVEGLLEELAASQSRTRIVRLRPSWVIGPAARVLLGRRAYVSLSHHDPELQVTWIDDAIAAFVAALHRGEAAGPFNVGAPGTVRSSEVAEILGVRGIRLPHGVRRAIAAAATRLRAPGALHPGFVDMDRYPIVLDSSRAQHQLEWRPGHDTREALKRFRATL